MDFGGFFGFEIIRERSRYIDLMIWRLLNREFLGTEYPITTTTSILWFVGVDTKGRASVTCFSRVLVADM